MIEKMNLSRWQKYTQTLNEASEYFEIGYKKLSLFVSQHSDADFILWNGNRILHTGESQRSDGKYMFRYVDGNGKTQCFYSWRLVGTDPIPNGKKDKGALRDKEKLIRRDLDDNIASEGDGYTVLNLAQKYIGQKTGVKKTTKAGYRTVLNLLERDPFGVKRIDKVKLSDAKCWLIKLQQECGKSYSTIHTIRGVLRPAFQMAVDDDLLRKNPFEFMLATVLVNDSVTREAITRKDESTFYRLRYVIILDENNN